VAPAVAALLIRLAGDRRRKSPPAIPDTGPVTPADLLRPAYSAVRRWRAPAPSAACSRAENRRKNLLVKPWIMWYRKATKASPALPGEMPRAVRAAPRRRLTRQVAEVSRVGSDRHGRPCPASDRSGL